MAKSAKPDPQPNIPNPARPNFWGMIMTIFTTAINKGQLPVLGIFLIVIIAISKMNSNQISNLVKLVLLEFKTRYILGWVLSFIETLGCIFLGPLYVKYLRSSSVMKRSELK